MNTPDLPESPVAERPAAGPIEGERGIPSVNRIRSLQSRVTSLLAIGFLSLMALGLLAWYYSRAVSNHNTDGKPRKTMRELVQGEMTLPPLGRVQGPRRRSQSAPVNKAPSSLWGTPPPSPSSPQDTAPVSAYAARAQNASAPVSRSGSGAPVDRRLSGAVSSSAITSFSESGTRGGAAAATRPVANFAEAAASGSPSGDLAQVLRPTATPAVSAQVLPTQRLLLPKGAFVDCTLETAMDSSLPGLVTCITATDVFGADGTTVLLERGTKLTGETKGEARRGIARIFVLWTEARTPTGVVAALDSPGTDELGRSGLPGQVHRHFFERFGAAMLVSVIEGAIDRATRAERGGDVILNPSGTESVVTEVLKSTVNIPNTLIKHQGDRIQVLVARDVDFRSVYELRPAAAAR